MQFIKKHYEKILLGVVLLGLAVAVALLPAKIQSDKQNLEEKAGASLSWKRTQLPPVDVARFDATLQRLEKPGVLNFSKPHNLFNPVPWQLKPDGKLIKVQTGNEIGPDALAVVKINPLFTTVALESVGASNANYTVSITRDAESVAAKRRKKSFIVEPGAKSEAFALLDAKAKSDAPDKVELILTLNDTGEKISISSDKPYQRVDGYSADLKYDPEKRVWLARRIGDKLQFAGDEFIVVGINQVATGQFEVVVSARSTGKKTTRPFSPDMQP